MRLSRCDGEGVDGSYTSRDQGFGGVCDFFYLREGKARFISERLRRGGCEASFGGKVERRQNDGFFFGR